MKLYSTDNGVCGSCGFVLYRDRDKNVYGSQITCQCANPGCPEFEIKYCAPSVELEVFIDEIKQ